MTMNHLLQKKPLFMKQSEREAFLEESKPRFEDKEDVDAGLLHQALESRASELDLLF